VTDAGSIWKEWTPAVVLSLVLNILMFGALPGLMERDNTVTGRQVPMRAVNFVRLRKEIPPVRPKPLPEKKQPPKAGKVPPQMSQPKRAPQLTLPFKPTRFTPLTPGTISVPLARGITIGSNPYERQWELNDLDRPLTPIVRIPPLYPLRAKRQGLEGWVRVKFLVLKTGKVDRIKIQASEPEGIFDNSVRRCVSSWNFKPGTVDGEPVDVWAETVVRFELK